MCIGGTELIGKRSRLSDLGGIMMKAQGSCYISTILTEEMNSM